MKKALTLLLCLVLAFSFVACGGSSSSAGGAPAGSTAGGASAAASTGGAAEGEVVKVGWIGSLTGDQAVWGQRESASVEMFFEELNAAGGLLGHPVEVIKYDTRGDATEAVNAVRRLTSQDGVLTIIGPNTSGQAIPLSPVLEEFKVTNIATVATNPKVTVNDDGTVKPYNFRICFIDPYQGSVAAGFAYDELGARTAALFYDVGDDYSQGICEYFEKTFVEKGGTMVASEAYKTGDVEFKPQLTKIKESGADVIFMPIPYKEVALSTRQARELGVESTFLGTDTWPSETLFEMAPEAVEGAFFVNHLDYADPAVQDVRTKFIDAFDMEPETNTYLAWDACNMFVASVEKAGSLDKEAIRDAMETIELDGITGHIKIGADTHNPEDKEAAIIEIKYGAFQFYSRYTPG